MTAYKQFLNKIIEIYSASKLISNGERTCVGASERVAQPRGASSRVSFCVLLLRDLWRCPPKLLRSLSNYTCLLFRLILFFGTRSENVLESRNLLFLNEFMAHAGL